MTDPAIDPPPGEVDTPPGTVGTPQGAPIPEVPAVEPVADVASITLGDVQSDPQLSLYIASADRVMDAMGYTEHGFRHAHLVGKIAYQVLRDRADGVDLMMIMAAIANHEEAEGTAVSPVSAAVILADKADVHRSRVRRPTEVDLTGDIHDRVNYAVEQSFLRVDSDARTVSLELTIDTKISQVMEYFEIFLGRMQMCRHAAEAVNARFQLFANGQELA